LQNWTIKKELEQNGQVERFSIFENKNQLTFIEVFNLWKNNSTFSNFYNNILTSSSFQSYFFETPPINKFSQQKKFEFVLVKSEALSRINANPLPFQKFFSKKESIVSFPNLGGDAQLVVPSPISENKNYPHLAKFIRNAPEEQRIFLWKKTAEEVEQKLNEKPIWLSTSGLRVYWLHLRIDVRPKYYQYHPYKKFTP